MRVFVMGLTIASAAFAGTSFNKDVAPILYKNCVTCHRPGEMAPMSLLGQGVVMDESLGSRWDRARDVRSR